MKKKKKMNRSSLTIGLDWTEEMIFFVPRTVFQLFLFLTFPPLATLTGRNRYT